MGAGDLDRVSYMAGVDDERARWQAIMARLLRLIPASLVLVVALALPALAAPFLECDPYPTTVTQPTHFAIVLDGAPSVDVPATPSSAGVYLHYDVGTVGSGQHNVTVKAVRVDPVWGRLESASVPFVFTRASAAPSPTGLKVVP